MSLLGLEALSLGGLALNIVSGFCADACKKQINHWLKYQNHDVPRCLREAWQLTLQDVTKDAISTHKDKLSSAAIENIRAAVAALTTNDATTRLFPANLTFVNRELLGMPGHSDPALVAKASESLVDAFASAYADVAPAAPPLPEPVLQHLRKRIFPPFSRYFIEAAFKHDQAAHRELQLQLFRWHSELLIDIKADTIHTRTKVDEIHDAIVGGKPPGGGPHPPTDNLTAASATQNNNFVGRTKQLDDLAALIQHPTTPTAVVIVAGAGFGKTELAKHFINVRAKAAPANADPAALAPDQWTARWWIDGSKGGEAASLALHYTTITGQPFPDEPRPAPDDDPAALAAAFRTKLRKDIASACKTGRQLLVIDNAETTQQINEYKPGNAGRLIATTRKQPIPQAVGHPFPLDVMSPRDSMDLLVSARPDLFATLTAARAAGRADPDGVVALRRVNEGKSLADPIEAVAAMSEHLGHHALALAYAAAALARPPFETPQAVLATMQAADVGAEGDILAEFDKDALGTQYKMGLAQSLGFLLDELADTASPTHDALALDLAGLAAFCNPAAIPVSLLVAASGAPEAAVKRSLRALHERSIVTLTDTANLHRLTQSLVRGRLRRAGGQQGQATLSRLLDALIDLFYWPATVEEEGVDHTKDRARMAAVAHAEAVIAHTDALTLPAGKGAAAAFPGTPSPVEAESKGELGKKVTRLRAEMAHRLMNAGQLADAARHIDAAIGWGEAQSPRDEFSLAIFYASRARIGQYRGLLKDADDDIGRSIAWFESQTPRNERELAIGYGSRARIRQDRGLLKEAEEDIVRAIARFDSQTPRDKRELAIWYASQARIRQARGDLAGAEDDIQRSIDWGETQSSRDERGLAIWYASRASIRRDRGDLAGAEDDIKRAIDWEESQAQPNQRELAIRYALRAGMRQDRGDLAGAEADIKRAIDWEESQAQPNQRELAIRYASRASIRRDRGGLAGAEDDIKKSIDWGEAQSPRDERSLAIWYASQARILEDQAIAARRNGDVDGAAALFAKAKADIAAALAWWEKNLPNDDRALGILRRDQARIDKAAEGE